MSAANMAPEQINNQTPLVMVPKPEEKPQVPATRQDKIVKYETFDGQEIEFSIELFRMMFLPKATREQAFGEMLWCKHNRIDPFTGEAHFSMIWDNILKAEKPTHQISKEAWYRRLEANLNFDWIKDGIRVDTTIQHLSDSLLTDGDDTEYQISDELKERLRKDFKEGKVEKSWMERRITIKKRGIFLSPGEILLGGWCVIKMKNRFIPYTCNPDVDGWKMLTKDGGDNVFWSRKAPFMINKSARKNCAKEAMPDLAGLIGTPEQSDDDGKLPSEYDRNLTDDAQRHILIRMLHAHGRKVPGPIGPLSHEELHKLSLDMYGGRGLTALTRDELSAFCNTITAAINDNEDVLNAMEKILNDQDATTNATGAGADGQTGLDG